MCRLSPVHIFRVNAEINEYIGTVDSIDAAARFINPIDANTRPSVCYNNRLRYAVNHSGLIDDAVGQWFYVQRVKTGVVKMSIDDVKAFSVDKSGNLTAPTSKVIRRVMNAVKATA